MKKSAMVAIVSLILAILFWCAEIFVNTSNFEIIILILAFVSSILFICFLCVSIFTLVAEKNNKKVSKYKMFAIIDGCIGVLVLAYSIYDIKTDTGWFAGLLGTILLLFVLPIVLLLLLADFIVWRIKR